MRNLKKMLSLVMALAMIASFMVVGASAAKFNDADDIQNTDAVGTLVSLGIIKGRDTGDFDPKGIVTRAEMAKMISVALNGGIDPNVQGGGLFADTKGHWAAGYIDSCAKMGIVAGDTNGKFNPNNTVTGTEAAKMILTAIGYKSDVEGFVNNANWDININVVAGNKGIYKGIAIDSAAGLTRDNAAQMIFNGVNASMVKYEMVGIVGGNGISQAVDQYIGNTNKAKTILTEKFEMVTDEPAILTGVSLDPKGTYTITLDEDTDNEYTYTKVADDYSNLLGQEVKVLRKSDSASVNPKSVYGVYATEDNATVTYNMSAAEINGAKVKVDGTSYSLDNTYAITDGEYAAAVLGASKLVNALSYNVVTLVDNDGDNKYEVAVITTTTAGKVTYASSTEIIAGGVSYKYEDENIADGLKKDDYVAVRYNIGNDQKDITKVEALTGKVEGYKTSSVTINGSSTTIYKYLVDGTWYVAGTAQEASAGDTMTLHAVNGVIVSSEKGTGTSSLSDVVFVANADTSGTMRYANIVRADGTKATVKYDYSSKDAITPAKGELYTYSETDDGYKFKQTANGKKLGDFTYDAGNSVTISDSKVTRINGKEIADDAIIFIVDSANAKSTMITGKQLKATAVGDASGKLDLISTSGNGSYSGKSANGLTRIMMAALTTESAGLPDIGNAAKNYALVVSDSYKMDGDYVTFQVFDGSSVVTVRQKDTSATYVQGDIVAYSSIDGDVIKDASRNNGTEGAVYGSNDDYVWVDGDSDSANRYEISKDTKILYFNASKDEAEEIGIKGGEIANADKVGGTYVKNVRYIVSGTAGNYELDMLLVEVTNNLGTKYATANGVGNGTYTLTTDTLTAKANTSVTYTITATSNNNAAATVKVTMDGQSAVVTVPAGGTDSKGSTTVAFLQPAGAAGQGFAITTP